MAHRDYVRRAQSTGTRRKKNTSRKKQQRSSVSPTMVAIAAAVVVAFVGALYFITHRAAEEIDVIPSHKAAGSGLPPKPEERWKYIKELENRQPGVTAPTEPSAGGEVINQKQLTNEQRQLLEQMQADMRQQPTQLNEVPWNGQQQAAARNNLQTRQPEQVTSQRTGQNQNTRTTAPAPAPYQAPAPTTPPKPAVTKREAAPATTPAPAAPVTTVTREPEAAKAPAQEKKDTRRWMVQCGSFKGAEQAETVRAQLAFEGFSSHITTNNGWNRVVIGPLNGRENADSTLSQLKLSGHNNCIRLPYGG